MKQMFFGAATLAALVALTPIALAHPGGGFGGGGFGHAGMSRGFGHGGYGFRHAGWGHMGSLRHSSFRSSGAGHHLRLTHTGHRGHSGGLTPAGFSHGKATWKQNGGNPPGWSKGNKKGWGCTPGSSGCKPPGIDKG